MHPYRTDFPIHSCVNDFIILINMFLFIPMLMISLSFPMCDFAHTTKDLYTKCIFEDTSFIPSEHEMKSSQAVIFSKWLQEDMFYGLLNCDVSTL